GISAQVTSSEEVAAKAAGDFALQSVTFAPRSLNHAQKSMQAVGHGGLRVITIPGPTGPQGHAPRIQPPPRTGWQPTLLSPSTSANSRGALPLSTPYRRILQRTYTLLRPLTFSV